MNFRGKEDIIPFSSLSCVCGFPFVFSFITYLFLFLFSSHDDMDPENYGKEYFRENLICIEAKRLVV